MDSREKGSDAQKQQSLGFLAAVSEAISTGNLDTLASPNTSSSWGSHNFLTNLGGNLAEAAKERPQTAMVPQPLPAPPPPHMYHIPDGLKRKRLSDETSDSDSLSEYSDYKHEEPAKYQDPEYEPEVHYYESELEESEEAEESIVGISRSGRKVMKPKTYMESSPDFNMHLQSARGRGKPRGRGRGRGMRLPRDDFHYEFPVGEVPLLKESFADHTTFCCICSLGDSNVNNRIVLCDKCDAPYHQNCHTPIIENHTAENLESTWSCQYCTQKALETKDSIQTEQVPPVPTKEEEDDSERCLSCACKVVPSWRARLKESQTMPADTPLSLSPEFRQDFVPKSIEDVHRIMLSKLCPQCHTKFGSQWEYIHHLPAPLLATLLLQTSIRNKELATFMDKRPLNEYPKLPELLAYSARPRPLSHTTVAITDPTKVTPVKRKRGRPPKSTLPVDSSKSSSIMPSQSASARGSRQGSPIPDSQRKIQEHVVSAFKVEQDRMTVQGPEDMTGFTMSGVSFGSYEDMIHAALAHRENDPDFKNGLRIGTKPKVIFAWMEANVPGLPENFRASATQALKKGCDRGRFIKEKAGQYRLNLEFRGNLSAIGRRGRKVALNLSGGPTMRMKPRPVMGQESSEVDLADATAHSPHFHHNEPDRRFSGPGIETHDTPSEVDRPKESSAEKLAPPQNHSSHHDPPRNQLKHLNNGGDGTGLVLNGPSEKREPLPASHPLKIATFTNPNVRVNQEPRSARDNPYAMQPPPMSPAFAMPPNTTKAPGMDTHYSHPDSAKTNYLIEKNTGLARDSESSMAVSHPPSAHPTSTKATTGMTLSSSHMLSASPMNANPMMSLPHLGSTTTMMSHISIPSIPQSISHLTSDISSLDNMTQSSAGLGQYHTTSMPLPSVSQQSRHSSSGDKDLFQYDFTYKKESALPMSTSAGGSFLPRQQTFDDILSSNTQMSMPQPPSHLEGHSMNMAPQQNLDPDLLQFQNQLQHNFDKNFF